MLTSFPFCEGTVNKTGSCASGNGQGYRGPVSAIIVLAIMLTACVIIRRFKKRKLEMGAIVHILSVAVAKV